MRWPPYILRRASRDTLSHNHPTLATGYLLYLTNNIQFAGTVHSEICLVGGLHPGPVGIRTTRLCYSTSVFMQTLAVILTVLFLKFNDFEPGEGCVRFLGTGLLPRDGSPIPTKGVSILMRVVVSVLGLGAAWRAEVLQVTIANGQPWFGKKALFSHLMQLFFILETLFIKDKRLLRETAPGFGMLLMAVVLYSLCYLTLIRTNNAMGGLWPYPFLEKVMATRETKVVFTLGLMAFGFGLGCVVRVLAIA